MKKTLAALLFVALPLYAQNVRSPEIPVQPGKNKVPGNLLTGIVKGERFWTETKVTGDVHGSEFYTSGRTDSETFTHYIFTLDTLGGIRLFESNGYAARLDAILDKGDKVVIRLHPGMKGDDGGYSITPSDIESVNGKKIQLKD